jgi:hypothetical protein
LPACIFVKLYFESHAGTLDIDVTPGVGVLPLVGLIEVGSFFYLYWLHVFLVSLLLT